MPSVTSHDSRVPPPHQSCTHTRRITTRDMSPRDALVVLGRRQCAPATARGARARLSIERARERVARVFSRVSFANAVDAEAPTREETPETPWGFDFGAKPRPRRARRIVGEGCLKRPRGRRSPRRSERSRRACGAGARGARADARATEIGARGAGEGLITEARRTEGTGGSECTTLARRRRSDDSTEAKTR